MNMTARCGAHELANPFTSSYTIELGVMRSEEALHWRVTDRDRCSSVRIQEHGGASSIWLVASSLAGRSNLSFSNNSTYNMLAIQ